MNEAEAEALEFSKKHESLKSEYIDVVRKSAVTFDKPEAKPEEEDIPKSSEDIYNEWKKGLSI